MKLYRYKYGTQRIEVPVEPGVSVIVEVELDDLRTVQLCVRPGGGVDLRGWGNRPARVGNMSSLGFHAELHSEDARYDDNFQPLERQQGEDVSPKGPRRWWWFRPLKEASKLETEPEHIEYLNSTTGETIEHTGGTAYWTDGAMDTQALARYGWTHWRLRGEAARQQGTEGGDDERD